MTTVIFVHKDCFVCGTRGRFADIGVINIGKPEYLDGRPGESHRSSLYMLMKRCSSCGYCALDIASGPSLAAEAVKDSQYKQQLNDKTYPETANLFLCWAMIQQRMSEYNEAGRATLFAAWICDDSNEHRTKAVECRKEAIKLFKKAQSQNQPFCNTVSEEQLLLIDFMRRAGLFEEARVLCEEEIKKSHSEKNKMILMFQENLIEKKDQRRHTLSEATTQ